VHAATSADDREDALDLLEIKDPNEIHVVFNCDVFSEGVDTPALDGVCYFDPRQSTVSIGQGNGRALRYQGDTKRAKIIIPILAPDTVTVEDFVRSSKFANLYAVTAALRHLGVVLSDPVYSYSSSARPITVKAQKHVGVFVTTPESYDHVLLRSVIGHLILNGPNVALTDVEVADRYITFWKTFKKVPKRTRSRTLVEQVEDALARQFETLDEEAKRIFIPEGGE
jgi:predicted helicase